MYSMHPVIALDLARGRARTLEAEVHRRRLATMASGSAPAGAPRRQNGLRRAVASALRAFASGAGHLAGSAGRAACRLEGDPA
jgi:hypothetical protein